MITRNVAGEERGFLFGTYTLRLIRELTRIEFIEDVFHGIANKKTGSEEPIRNQLDHMEFLNKFLFACAKHACVSDGKKADFSEATVADWMDEIGLVETMNLLTELIKSYATKNQKAPVTAGLAEQQ